MPARRIRRPPVTVAVASLADTGDPAVDRVTIQAEQALQDLQEKARINAAAIALLMQLITTRPTVTGSRGGIAALGSLLTELAKLNLITDGTTP